MTLWAVEIDGFAEVCVEAESEAQARWRTAKAAHEAGYGSRREGPFGLIRRGVRVKAAGVFEEMHLTRIGGDR